MADVASTTEAPHAASGAGHEHGHHSPHLAHHFDSLVQQFDASKLGMWLFLSTEILLFAGLFCAYAVYRRTHPELFIEAHHHLNTTLGAINTVVLLISSFTMAYAVKMAQVGRQKALIISLSLTLLGGCGFMVIKGFEYAAKFEHGIYLGKYFSYDPSSEHAEMAAHGEAAPGQAHAEGPSVEGHVADAPGTLNPMAHAAEAEHREAATPGDTTGAVDLGAIDEYITPNAGPVGQDPLPMDPPAAASSDIVEYSSIKPAASGPLGMASATHEKPEEHEPNLHIFFGIYFVMTGLHGVHVLAGMAVIAWLIVRAAKGHFSPDYFTPVDLGGLYWHLVDLIWIYLFPLLYLIH